MGKEMELTRQALNAARGGLMGCANVVATGIGYKVTGGIRTEKLCLVCSVTRKLPLSKISQKDLIPSSLNGIPTDVVETGRIRALAERTARYRPAPGGVSIGHRSVTAGTLGCLVHRDGEAVILSNNHVLANSNDAAPGDAILQPGAYDGGVFPQDQLAELIAFVPVRFVEAPSDCSIAGNAAALLNSAARALGSRTRFSIHRIETEANLVDAAIARPLRPEDVSPDILELGIPSGLARGELGARVKKSGRTTGLTEGEILQVDVTVNVEYGTGRVAQFADQLLAGAMSQGGDSGSAVLDTEGRLVGLLFAGSESTTLFNRIEHVFGALNLVL